jgi:2,5-diketo-D-gluconate reductase A
LTVVFANDFINYKLKEQQREKIDIPTIEIAPGVHMPMQGLGTWLYNDTRVYDSIINAMSLGYKLIDTAYDYGNAKGIAKALIDSKKTRTEYWITSKVEGGLSFNDTIKEAMTNL